MVFKFPTVFREAQIHERRNAFDFDGEKWVVGENALTHKRACRYIRDVEELVRYYPLFLLASKKKAKTEENQVAVSLPLDVYVLEKEKKEAGADNLLDKLSFNCNRYGFSVSVHPQGIAGLQHLIDERKVDDSSYTLLIDGGFNTVNTAVVSPELQVVFFKTFTDEVGIRNLIEDFFREELLNRFPTVSTNLVVLKEVFLKEKVDTGLKVEDIKPEKERAVSRYLDRFFSRIVGELKRAGVDYDQIVFIGGLSYYLSPDDFETNKKLYIPKDGGEFLNVLGLLSMSELPFAVDLGFGDCKVAVEV